MGLGRTTSILGVCAAAAGAGGLLSGCGASSTLDPVAQAADVTAQQQGAQIALTEQLSGANLPAAATITGMGFTNFANQDTKLTLSYSGVPGLSSSGSSTAIFELQYPVLYLNFPALTSQLPGGKQWVKLDLSAALKAKGINLSQLSSGGGIDPNQYLNYLRASGSTVTTVGRQTINGVPTTHYHAIVDLSKVAGAVPQADRASMQAGITELEQQSGITTFPIDVWIDDQQHVRREQFTLTSTAQGHTFHVAATVDFLSFGPTPSVTPPPADQVFDLTSVLATGGSSTATTVSGTATAG